MSFAGRIAGMKGASHPGSFSSRIRVSVRSVLDLWRSNLPEGWWLSLACAGSSVFVLSLIRILLYGFA